jgi:hypothetical protein
MHVPRRGSSPNRFLITLFTISNSPPRSRDAFSAPGVCIIASLTPIEGWAERRETFGCLRDTRWARRIASKTRVNALMTRRARRLRGALRPMTRRTIGGNNATISTISAASVPIVSQTAVRRGHRMHGSFAVRLWHHRRDASRADRCGARQPARALIAACVRT